jgi:hypothetical protein
VRDGRKITAEINLHYPPGQSPYKPLPVKTLQPVD